MASRVRLNKLLWVAVKRLDGGEATLRRLVTELHQEDGTTPRDGLPPDSTRGLSDTQHRRLVDRVLAMIGHPGILARPRSAPGAVAGHFASAGEKAQIQEVARLLGWSDDTLEDFIRRQTKGRGVRTHNDATAVLAPMKRMLRERGNR